MAFKEVWIRGTDEESEWNWKWVTGEPWSYSNWAYGEPNNYIVPESYLMMLTSEDWNDAPDDVALLPFVCEFDSLECK
uniref:lectin-like protein n=1 Tax=Candidatus Electronema sp. TaxID=2698783 RepID=UPI004056D077